MIEIFPLLIFLLIEVHRSLEDASCFAVVIEDELLSSEQGFEDVRVLELGSDCRPFCPRASDVYGVVDQAQRVERLLVFELVAPLGAMSQDKLDRLWSSVGNLDRVRLDVDNPPSF